MQSLKVSGIIHLFALLHAAVALLCRVAGVNDELILTLLTIVLIVLICLRRGLNVEFTASSVIVVNVIGYLLGTDGGSSGSPGCSAAATTPCTVHRGIRVSV